MTKQAMTLKTQRMVLNSGKTTDEERQLRGTSTETNLSTSTKLHDRSSEVRKKPRTSDSVAKRHANVKRTAGQSVISHKGSTEDSLSILLTVQG